MSVNITEFERDNLEGIATKLGTNRSEVVREGIKLIFDKYKSQINIEDLKLTMDEFIQGEEERVEKIVVGILRKL